MTTTNSQSELHFLFSNKQFLLRCKKFQLVLFLISSHKKQHKLWFLYYLGFDFIIASAN